MYYFSGLHNWFPFLSQKEKSETVMNLGPRSNVTSVLLALTMKLLSNTPFVEQGEAISSLYQQIKELSQKVENCGLISMDLIQSLVLLAVYEIGHAIYPAAYLSVSRAARLGFVMGLHNRKSLRLYMQPATWTRREEERRTWWAIYILDRYVNNDRLDQDKLHVTLLTMISFLHVGISGLPMTAPDPSDDELLPCPEHYWDLGQVGINQPLFVQSLPADLPSNLFGSTCQSAHILGSVIRHRDHKDFVDQHLFLAEAQQLHRALDSLRICLHRSCFVDEPSVEKANFIALALCCSARFILYGMYACNEHRPFTGPRIAEEITMQEISMKGLGSSIDDAHLLAQRVLGFAAVSDRFKLLCLSPLLCHCIYQAISECAWICQEAKGSHREAQLQTLITSLQTMGRVWNVVGMKSYFLSPCTS